MMTTTFDSRRSKMVGPMLSALAMIAMGLAAVPAIAQDLVPSLFRPSPADAPEKARLTARVDSLGACVSVSDLDFGGLGKGEKKTMILNICNTGQGEVRFQAPWVTFVRPEFAIAQSEIDKLKNAVLGPSNCVQIAVTFQSATAGNYRDVVRIWASTRTCRDTSVLTAKVTLPGPAVGAFDWGGRWLTTLDPCSKSGTGEYPTDVPVYNTGQRAYRVTKIMLTGPDADAGYFKLDSSNQGTLVKVGDVIEANSSQTAHRQRVLFRPKEVRSYNATLVVITDSNPPDTIKSTLSGLGTEGHVAVTGHAFDTLTITPSVRPTADATLQLTSPSSTRTVTISGVTLSDPTDFSLLGIKRADGSAITTPFTMSPGETVTLTVRFAPQSDKPTEKSSKILISGDFSKCDDSTNTLVGYALANAKVAWGAASAKAALGTRVEPNPVTASTTISFLMEERGHATVELFDASGARLATLLDGMAESGERSVTWSPEGLPSGIYYCRIGTGAWSVTRPVVVAR